jgi:uncharacterized protein DUF4261
MAKGYFTQCAVVLLEAAPRMAQVQELLRAFPQDGVRTNPDPGWMGGPEALVLPFRPEANGLIVVDWLESPWPDGMGDPQADPILFGAWSMGFFGPFTFPGSLERAVQHAWGWQDAGPTVQRHQAFLRVRSSYAFGAKDDDPIFPEDYDPLPELEQVTEITRALLSLPEALCYFNPGGETLHTAAALEESLDHHADHDLPPFDIWSNIRFFNVEEGRWLMMDTVGMGQLDVEDHEACFPRGAFEPNDVAWFLRNAVLYLLRSGPVVKAGDTMNGPGEVNWQAQTSEESLIAPPRRTLRWFPLDGSRIPESLLPGE